MFGLNTLRVSQLAELMAKGNKNDVNDVEVHFQFGCTLITTTGDFSFFLFSFFLHQVHDT